MALFDNKIEEKADPKVQIEQSIQAAKEQHQELSKQAAAVIGNQRQLEIKLNRQLAEVEKLQGNTRQALSLADKARSEGNSSKAVEYENAAEAFAAQLVTTEQSVEDLKQLHDQALQQAQQAKAAVERNAMALKQKTEERTKLLSQLEQAKMQEKVADSISSMNKLTANDDSPNLDQVRDKIEKRYSNALGRAELAENSVENRMVEVQQASVQMAGHSRLEEIRASMNSGGPSGANADRSIAGFSQRSLEQSPQNGSDTDNSVHGEFTRSSQGGDDVSQDAVAEKLRQLREGN